MSPPRFNNLKTLLEFLVSNNFLKDASEYILEYINFDTCELYDTENKDEYSYDHEVFAKSLMYYGPDGYKYLKEILKLKLPPMAKVAEWLINDEGEPGFTMQSLDLLKDKVDKNDHPIYCCLSIDEQRVEKYDEYEEFGEEYWRDGDCCDRVQYIYVYYVTCLNSNLKLPVGYIMTAHVEDRQKVNMLLRCLEVLHNTGVQVVAVTLCEFGGLGPRTQELLGVSFKSNPSKTTFPHPVTNEPVAVLIDPIDTLNLLTVAIQSQEKKLLKNLNGEIILWSYIHNLNKLQDQENTVLIGRLRDDDVENIKKKIKLQMVTTPIVEKRNIKYIVHSKPEAELLQVFSNLFDVMKCRSSKDAGHKRSIGLDNKMEAFDFLSFAEKYISSLKSREGPMIQHRQFSCGFLSLLACIQSVKHLFHDLVEGNKVERLSLIDFSLQNAKNLANDARISANKKNLESWFYPYEFKEYYKYLVKSQLLGSGSFLSNSSSLKVIQATTVPKFEIRVDNHEDSREQFAMGLFYPELKRRKKKKAQEKWCFEFGLSESREFENEINVYNTCLVISCILKDVKCDDCINAFLSPVVVKKSPYLTRFKDTVLLKYLSKDIMEICEMTERAIRHLSITRWKMPRFVQQKILKEYVEDVTKNVLENIIGTKILDNMICHQFDQAPMENHLVHLIKVFIGKYVELWCNK